MTAESITVTFLMGVITVCLLGYCWLGFWPDRWTPSGRQEIRDHAEAKAAQERKEAAERIRERRTWRAWAERVAWDDTYQSISEQVGIECSGCQQRYRPAHLPNLIDYGPTCPLHKHRFRTLSPVYKFRRHRDFSDDFDTQEVLDRLDIIPPTYTEEGTLK
ncbi:MAG: hypothetical protein ACTHYO_10365 [Micrococcaceae bacterium]